MCAYIATEKGYVCVFNLLFTFSLFLCSWERDAQVHTLPEKSTLCIWLNGLLFTSLHYCIIHSVASRCHFNFLLLKLVDISSVGLGEKLYPPTKRCVREDPVDIGCFLEWDLGSLSLCVFYFFISSVSKRKGTFCCCVISRLAPTVLWRFSKAALLCRFIPIPLQPYMEGKRKWSIQGSAERKKQAFTFWKLSFFSGSC